MLKTLGARVLKVKMRPYRSRSTDLLVGWGDSGQLSCRRSHAIGITKTTFLLTVCQPSHTQPLLDGAQVGQIPAFEFVAGNANQGVRVGSLFTFVQKGALDRMTIRRILITKHDKSRARNLVSSHPSCQVIVEILLAVEYNETA